jgi:hypothetical protein
MATHLRSNTAAESAVDVVDSIAAALETDPQTEHLAPVWTALVSRGDALVADLVRVRRTARRARSRLWVLDAIWDAVMRGFDRAALDAVDGQKQSPGYTRFWRSGTAAEVTRFGADREVDVARAIIGMLPPAPHTIDPLRDTWVPKLTPATDALAAASTARREAVVAIGPYLSAQFLYVEDVNLELDRLEGALQGIFPGDAKRVASYLAATRRDDAGAADATPATPMGTDPASGSH